MLQISSGILRGTQLRSPHGKQTRPSSERLRQGIFNVLRHFRWQESDSNIVEGATVLDLFAGTGAWGIEALSNGASSVWFVESDASALRTLRHNVDLALRRFESQSLAPPRVEIVATDVLRAYGRLPETRLIFCDPPYNLGWFEKVDRAEASAPRLVPGGVFLYEAGKSEELPPSTARLRAYSVKNYGDSAVHFFIKDRPE